SAGQAPGHLVSAPIGQRHVEQHELRRELVGEREARLAVGRLADDLEALSFQEPPRGRAKYRMVVDDQHRAACPHAPIVTYSAPISYPVRPEDRSGFAPNSHVAKVPGRHPSESRARSVPPGRRTAYCCLRYRQSSTSRPSSSERGAAGGTPGRLGNRRGVSAMTDVWSQGRVLPLDWDAIVVGSGFGGSMAALELVRSGKRVLMLERGDWVRRGRHNWTSEGFCFRSESYSLETPYRAVRGAYGDRVGSINCVGGASVYYGGVSLRYRAADFEPDPEIVGDSGAEWPVRYAGLGPYYAAAESLIGVAGEAGCDPCEPPRSSPFPARPGALAPTSRLIWEAAERLGLHPFRLPLAINHKRGNGLSPCVSCPTCDGFACAVRAKNDLATAILPMLVRGGLQLETNQAVVRLRHDGSRITQVDAVDRLSGARRSFRAGAVFLAAGALASPHLVLASG